ncbi:alpha/beta fold hydrolase [Bradyrhizobium oligotrophicum S58]
MTATAHQPPQTVRANGIDICYEIFGDPAAPPLVLIMGLGGQMIIWYDEFCEQLASRGFRVIRFDNRDIGQSSKLHGGRRLTPFELIKLRFFNIPVSAPYKLLDMAKDTVGLMDALDIKSAHLVGASMGGMIAQEIAISFPQRVRSLTSIMSTTGNPRIPPPTREVAMLLMAPRRRPRTSTSSASRRPGRRCASARFPRTRQMTWRSPNAASRAASIQPASDVSCARSWPPAAASRGCIW